MSENKVLSLEEQRLMDTITELGREFGEVPPSDIPTIREDFFVRVFLPLFAGDETNPYKVTETMWLNVSFSPFAEVRVVDNQNQELFMVPPLYDRSVVKPMTGAGEERNMPTITDMLARARLVGKQGPVAMNRYLTEELERRNFVVESDGVKSIAKRWIEIFQRYDRLPKDLNFGTQSTGVQTSTIADIGRDSSEFDPLPD